MPYIESVCIAGKTIEIEKYYSSRYKKKGIKRSKNKKPTSEQQKEVNNRKAEKKLRQLINANFQGGDFHMVLNYAKENRPDTKDEMRIDLDKFLRDARKEYKKAGLTLKYIHVPEIGEKGARHHHLVINNIDINILRKIWDKGRIHCYPLDDTGQYSELASYLIKYTEKVMGTDEEIQGRRWNCSRNLIHPETKKKIISHRECYKDKPMERKGYYVDKNSIRSGIHDETGYPYFTYTLIKTEPNGKKGVP